MNSDIEIAKYAASGHRLAAAKFGVSKYKVNQCVKANREAYTKNGGRTKNFSWNRAGTTKYKDGVIRLEGQFRFCGLRYYYNDGVRLGPVEDQRLGVFHGLDENHISPRACLFRRKDNTLKSIVLDGQDAMRLAICQAWFPAATIVAYFIDAELTFRHDAFKRGKSAL